MGGGADDPSYDSFSSRWGIKGSSEVSEGLTAVYKFETRIGQGSASQDTNQLYTGLSGGFGNLTLGKQVGATYNHTGAIRDISNWHSYGDVGSRISNALSYSYAAESFSMQVAAIMDADTDTDGAVDQVEFGMTVGLGDIGKVAIGYEKVEDSMADNEKVSIHGSGLTFDKDGIGGTDKLFLRDTETMNVVPTKSIELADGYMVIEVVSNSATAITSGMIREVDGVYYNANTGTCFTDADALADECKGTSVVAANKHTVLVMVGTGVEDEMPENREKAGTMTYTVVDTDTDNGLEGRLKGALTGTGIATTYGHKASHISASFGLAGITVALGHTTKDSNSPMMNDKMKTNFLGASGSIGDTGLSWNAWGRNVKNHEHVNGDDRSPWTVGLAKSLGGGATTFIEHTNADDGEDGTTSVALRVDF